MSQLDRAADDLNDAVKRHLEINPGLEAILNHASAKKMREQFAAKMKMQISELLRSDLFDDINTRLHPAQKAETVGSESDDLEVEDAVRQNITPLSDDHKFADMFADFLMLVFNMGGQDFLNKQNIPATFDLRNEDIKSGIKSQSLESIKGIDNTTVEWVRDQISSGRSQGMSNADIADQIREAVPDTYDGRAERIVRTETSFMVGQSEHVTADRNGASHKEWVTVGGACDICTTNESAGLIGFDESFPSGDLHEPAHPNCRCVVEYQFTPFMGSIWSGQ